MLLAITVVVFGVIIYQNVYTLGNSVASEMARTDILWMELTFREDASDIGWETSNFGAQKVYLSSNRHAPSFPARADAVPRSSIAFFSDVPSLSLNVFL